MRYWEIIRDLGLEPLWGEFVRSNPSNRNPYHNLIHTTYMIEDAYEGAMAMRLPALKAHVLAAMYHDWGHTGGIIRLNPKLIGTGLGPGTSEAYPDSHNIKIATDKVMELARGDLWPVGVNVVDVILAIKATEFPYTVSPEKLTLSGRILRDADVMTSGRETMIAMCDLGLAAELGINDLVVMAEREKAFLSSIEPSTIWGKATWSLMLPRIIAEHDAFIRALGGR